MNYAQLTGRLATGAQLGHGHLWHAVDTDREFPNFATAVCGAKPGRRSNGWSDALGTAVTCPRCIKKLVKLKEPTP